MNRTSRQREAILRVLSGTHSHPTAEWVYEQVKEELPCIGLATVYRNLRRLTQEGEISEMNRSNDAARFDGNTATHYHFRCERCGRILDLDEPVDATIETRVARRTGLRVTGHHLELRGLCFECHTLATHKLNRVQQ